METDLQEFLLTRDVTKKILDCLKSSLAKIFFTANAEAI